ncbi:MAG: succinate dehydrogenase / fumarate reductase cytochrome b subunit [Flavobacteriaceae bacterium]
MVDKKRPVNLDIGTFSLPLTAWVSISHRISGVIMFFALAGFLWMLDASLESPENFAAVKGWFAHPLCQIAIWGSLAALAYHVVAGIRHLMMDFGFGEDSFESGLTSARIVVVLSVAIIIFITAWIFLW